MVTLDELLVQTVSLLGVLDGDQHFWVDELLPILLDINIWLAATTCSQLNFLHGLAT